MCQGPEKFLMDKNIYGLIPGTILNALPLLANLIPKTVPGGVFHCHPHLL